MTNPITLIQLSDLHLSGKIGQSDSYQRFLACLNASRLHTPDYYLLTGDLANHGDKAATDWLFDVMHAQNVPFFAIAGNHDVTVEDDESLPFHKRRFAPKAADERLMGDIAVDLGAWRLLLMDSTVAGQIYGNLCLSTLLWLDKQLSTHNKPTLIALHHHPLRVKSAWIDHHMLQNADQLWQVLGKHVHAKLIVCGHVHQTHRLQQRHTIVHTAPSTYQQFLPYATHFALDDLVGGFNKISLYSDTFDVTIHRVI